MNKKHWYYISIVSILVSIVTLFLPIVTYTPKGAAAASQYNILGLLNGDIFVCQVLNQYRGKVFSGFSLSATANLTFLVCVIGVLAIIASFWGLRSMVKQYTSAKPFRLTMAGLIGTAIPALTLLVLYAVSRDHFPGQLRLGLYVYVTPLSMILACITVTRRYRLTQEQVALQQQAAQYLHPAGDLN